MKLFISILIIFVSSCTFNDQIKKRQPIDSEGYYTNKSPNSLKKDNDFPVLKIDNTDSGKSIEETKDLYTSFSKSDSNYFYSYFYKYGENKFFTTYEFYEDDIENPSKQHISDVLNSFSDKIKNELFKSFRFTKIVFMSDTLLLCSIFGSPQFGGFNRLVLCSGRDIYDLKGFKIIHQIEGMDQNTITFSNIVTSNSLIVTSCRIKPFSDERIYKCIQESITINNRTFESDSLNSYRAKLDMDSHDKYRFIKIIE
jgi:hypothetical protein